ncbi:inositol monophosphatase family protein [Actinokineospora sp. NBRC 105648]|uniref:inositol monophosphatase family protein n=1 Tax=Actinokineospora sp. NBRC 105648 TaxID=3032206 RepID=UPI0024A37E66|nr:inositol monophosphatase family protein [Actinokineospora sp. NBRC 105648]GLZ38757.1 inositol monophosphatase [Actinokineospora sp. NBRC 105648]
MGSTEQHLAEIALTVAAEAADLARTTRGSAIRDVGTKSTSTDVVTAADHAAEQLIRDRLAALRPGDAVLGEEAGGAAGSGVTWVVDPIDGTVNYLYGYPWYAVSVAAQVNGASVAGAVVEPASGRRWTAARGHGSWLDGERLRVSAPAGLDVALLATGFAYAPERRRAQAAAVARLLGRVRDIRRSGSAALDLCAVAAGWVDAYCERGLSRWDWAAGALIAQEAGAVVDLPGAAPELGADAVFAAAPEIAGPLRAALVDAGMGEF